MNFEQFCEEINGKLEDGYCKVKMDKPISDERFCLLALGLPKFSVSQKIKAPKEDGTYFHLPSYCYFYEDSFESDSDYRLSLEIFKKKKDGLIFDFERYPENIRRLKKHLDNVIIDGSLISPLNNLNLSHQLLKGSFIKNSEFKNIDFSHSNLTDSLIEKSVFRLCNFNETDFEGTRGEGNVIDSCTLRNAKIPKNLNFEKHSVNGYLEEFFKFKEKGD